MSRVNATVPAAAGTPTRVTVESTATNDIFSSTNLLAACGVALAGVAVYSLYTRFSSDVSSQPRRSAMSSSKKPLVVTVTGAAGQIGYSIIFLIAGGKMLGHDQPIELRLLDMSAQHTPPTPIAQRASVSLTQLRSCCACSPPMIGVVQGVIMELDDCAFPLLTSQLHTIEPT